MGDFVDIPIEVAPQAMLERFVTEMESLVEGWNPNLGEAEILIAQAVIYRLVVPIIQLASSVPATIFDTFGREIVKVGRQEALRAYAASTWTMVDNAGYTIPAGTQVDLVKTGSERIGFIVVSTVVVPPGETATAEGAVLLEAIEPGENANALEGEGILVDALNFVVQPGGIVLDAPTSNGRDEEPPTEYLGRLAETMQTFIEGVVRARDVAIVARNVPGVGRVAVIDNYNAETEEDEQEKTTTLVVANDDGLEVASGVKDAVLAKMEEKREVNYLFFVEDSTYSTIEVEGSIVPMLGYDKGAAIVNTEAMLDELNNPAHAFEQPEGDAASWVNSKVVRYQDVVTAINNSQGVDHVDNLKIGKNGGAKGTADLTLTGLAPLPKPGAYTLT